MPSALRALALVVTGWPPEIAGMIATGFVGAFVGFIVCVIVIVRGLHANRR